MRIAVIEDEIPALNRIKKLLKEVEPNVEILWHADSIETAIEMFSRNTEIDLALFDIELADGQSFEILKNVDIACPVIFTTAYDEFALQAFKYNSIDYLLKPINKEELSNAIQKFKKLNLSESNNKYAIKKLLEGLNHNKQLKYKSRFLVKLGERLISVQEDDIAYFISKDKITYLITVNNQKYATDVSIENIVEQINPINYFQLNRQIIAHLKSIKQINNYFNGKLKIVLNPPTDDDIFVSRERAAAFKSWLDV